MTNKDATMSSNGRQSEIDELRTARDEFMRTVDESINRAMEENGYNRDRATNLILREVGATSTRVSEDDLHHVQQRYRLTHDQAERAYVVSRAIKKLIQKGGDSKSSHVEAMRCLTARLSKASFAHNNAVDVRDIPKESSEIETTTRKASEIHIRDIPKQQQQQQHPSVERRPKTPSKRSKVISSTCNKSSKTKSCAKVTRKRILDEIGTVASQPSESHPQGSGILEPRSRADSVTHSVSVKMQQNDPVVLNPDKPAARSNKRRSTGSLDESDAGPVVKRTRSTTA